jgi:hypothetical protein
MTWSKLSFIEFYATRVDFLGALTVILEKHYEQKATIQFPAH